MSAERTGATLARMLRRGASLVGIGWAVLAGLTEVIALWRVRSRRHGR
ncbi:MAG: hypothetical protein KDF95_11880 [Rhodocyclaceae bacterium]|nr:hypothetical protein [Rhodocyclaceae bacterium]